MANARAGALVIGADTSVVLNGGVLGKPDNEAEALEMLTALRGRLHRVVTAVTVSRDGMATTSVTSSDVAMREYSDAEMEAYIESGEPFDKAGGYAIQDGGFAPVSAVDRMLPQCGGISTVRGDAADDGGRSERRTEAGMARAGAMPK